MCTLQVSVDEPVCSHGGTRCLGCMVRSDSICIRQNHFTSLPLGCYRAMIAFAVALLRRLSLYAIYSTTGPSDNAEECPPVPKPISVVILGLAALHLVLAVSVYMRLGRKGHVPRVQSFTAANQGSRVGGGPDTASPATSAARLPLTVSESCAA